MVLRKALARGEELVVGPRVVAKQFDECGIHAREHSRAPGPPSPPAVRRPERRARRPAEPVPPAVPPAGETVAATTMSSGLFKSDVV